MTSKKTNAFKCLSYTSCRKRYPLLPYESKGKYYFPKPNVETVLSLDAKSLRGHIKALARETVKLLTGLNIECLVFLPEVRCPWLLQQNEYKPVKAAEAYFLSNGITNNFDGGVEVAVKNLPSFLPPFFWMIRCNADLPAFNFIDAHQNLTGFICKHGNLHLFTLNNAMEEAFEKLKKTSSLYPIAWHQCSNKYYTTSAIKGRKINL